MFRDTLVVLNINYLTQYVVSIRILKINLKSLGEFKLRTNCYKLKRNSIEFFLGFFTFLKIIAVT
mgnify:CR=1 FL=1